MGGQGRNFHFRSGDGFSEDIFENFFSGFDFGPGVRTTFRSRRQGNKSVNVRMAISIKEAMNILNLRKDNETIAQVTTKKKQDDMSDCLLMTITYSYLHFIDKKI